MKPLELVNSAKAHRQMSDTLYANALLACVRELISNAADASVAAEKRCEDVVVDLPTATCPQFVVRDRGIGLTFEQLRDVVPTYFKSTKTDSDEQTGAKGLGVKSPFAVANHFVVVSVHKGKRTRALGGVLEDGRYGFDALDVEDTDEPDGTTVTVPVDPVRAVTIMGLKDLDTENSPSLGLSLRSYYAQVGNYVIHCARHVSHPLSVYQGRVQVRVPGMLEKSPVRLDSWVDAIGPLPKDGPAIAFFAGGPGKKLKGSHNYQDYLSIQWTRPESLDGERRYSAYAFVPGKALTKYRPVKHAHEHQGVYEDLRNSKVCVAGVAYPGGNGAHLRLGDKLFDRDITWARIKAYEHMINEELNVDNLHFMDATYARSIGFVPSDSRESVQRVDRLRDALNEDILQDIVNRLYSRVDPMSIPGLNAVVVHGLAPYPEYITKADGSWYAPSANLRDNLLVSDMRWGRYSNKRLFHWVHALYPGLAKVDATGKAPRTPHAKLSGNTEANQWLFIQPRKELSDEEKAEVAEFIDVLLTAPATKDRVKQCENLEIEKVYKSKAGMQFYGVQKGGHDRPTTWVYEEAEPEDRWNEIMEDPDSYAYAIIRSRKDVQIGDSETAKTTPAQTIHEYRDYIADLGVKLVLIPERCELRMQKAGVRRLDEVFKALWQERAATLDDDKSIFAAYAFRTCAATNFLAQYFSPSDFIHQKDIFVKKYTCALSMPAKDIEQTRRRAAQWDALRKVEHLFSIDGYKLGDTYVDSFTALSKAKGKANQEILGYFFDKSKQAALQFDELLQLALLEVVPLRRDVVRFNSVFLSFLNASGEIIKPLARHALISQAHAEIESKANNMALLMDQAQGNNGLSFELSYPIESEDVQDG